MPLYWVAAQQAGNARALSQAAQQNIAAGLAALGWVIAAGVAWWYGETKPEGDTEIFIEFDPAPSWACCEHPYSDCYGQEWGCMGGSGV